MTAINTGIIIDYKEFNRKKNMTILKFPVLMLLVLILNNTLTGQFGSWTKIGDMPYPVAGGKAVVIDTTIYVIGGYSDSLESNVDFIQAYYPESQTWSIVGHLPEPRYGFIAGEIDGKIIICGGISDAERISNSLLTLTIDTAGVQFYSDTSFIANRMFSAGLTTGRNLYLFGGFPAANIADTNDKAYIIRYDFATENTVFQNSTLYLNNEFPIQQMISEMNRSIYLFGGVHNGILDDIYRFDTDSNYYVKLITNLLEPRAGGEAVAFPEYGEVYVIGGYNENSDALFSVEKLTFYGDFILVDQHEPLIDERKEFMAVRYGEFLIIMGGKDENNNVIRSIEQSEHAFATEVNNENVIRDFQLYPNYPNPFNPGTMISFNIPQSGNVKLSIYSVLGEVIKEFDQVQLNAGYHKIYWNGTDNTGAAVSAGVYFTKIEFGSKFLTRKMLLVK